ncbi:SGNH hydrolase [Pholiota molesta]|nr:SGNH hydrolase [Pholiota molesta]
MDDGMLLLGWFGFKVHVKNLRSLTLNLGEHTTSPFAAIGVSVDGSDFVTVNASQAPTMPPITLHTLQIVFPIYRDSLSAGQFLPQGVDQAWPFLVGEAFKAEHRVNAQPGAALTDILSYGNVHGVSYQYFNDPHRHPHRRQRRSQNVTDAQFVQVYSDFIDRLRVINRNAPIFVFTPWGWPNADGIIGYYYQGQYETIVNARKAKGDKNIFLVDTTGWVSYADVFPANQHPNVAATSRSRTNSLRGSRSGVFLLDSINSP